MGLPPIHPEHPVACAVWAAFLDEATELDRKTRVVLALLEKEGLVDNTIIVFSSDHEQGRFAESSRVTAWKGVMKTEV